MGVDRRRVRGQGGIDGRERRQFLPGNWEGRRVKCLDGLLTAYNDGHSFAAKTRFMLCEDALIREWRNDSVAVHSGHILRGKDRLNSGMRCDELIEIAEDEPGAMVRAAHGLYG